MIKFLEYTLMGLAMAVLYLSLLWVTLEPSISIVGAVGIVAAFSALTDNYTIKKIS